MDFHPLANVMPLLEGDEFDRLVEDVKTYGIKVPITLLDGMILDGRNRYRASKVAGVPCPHVEFINGNAVAFVVSMNVKRRHLTTSQRAMIAAELANMQRGGDKVSEQSAILRNGQISQPEAARLLNVGERSVQTASFVREHGTEDEKQSVASGERKASRVANNIRDRQRRAAAPPPSVPTTQRQIAQARDYMIKVMQVERTCSTVLEIQIPTLSDAQRAEAVKMAATARQAVGRLLQDLRKET